mmetsp:Transcript_3229/g.12985  ORF Transcript_3229/g.12985 Transcript_3229/m.12985 type:complete len:252 (+) Transcript_3229:1808-2563(+)
MDLQIFALQLDHTDELVEAPVVVVHLEPQRVLRVRLRDDERKLSIPLGRVHVVDVVRLLSLHLLRLLVLQDHLAVRVAQPARVVLASVHRQNVAALPHENVQRRGQRLDVEHGVCTTGFCFSPRGRVRRDAHRRVISRAHPNRDLDASRVRPFALPEHELVLDPPPVEPAAALAVLPVVLGERLHVVPLALLSPVLRVRHSLALQVDAHEPQKVVQSQVVVVQAERQVLLHHVSDAAEVEHERLVPNRVHR